MSPMSGSEALAQFVSELTFDSVPQEVISKAKTHLLDSVGVGLAGSQTQWGKSAIRVFQGLHGPAGSTVFGRRRKVAAPNAAIANGVSISALEYDDTDYVGGGGHMSRVVVAAALAAGEAFRCSGKELLTAIVAGYEAASRIGSALLLDRYGPRSAKSSWSPEDLAAHKRMQEQGAGQVRGHITGLFAAALVAGKLMGLSRKELVSAQGLVGGLGLFLGQSHREGTDALLLHAGWAAHAGLLAAQCARQGLTGPRHIYEGDRGLLSVVGGGLQDSTQLAAGLGSRWNTLNNTLKFLPGGHGAHHFVESLAALIEERSLSVDDVQTIECRAPAQRIEFHFEPRETKLRPTPYNALFSLPYLLARLLSDGKLGALSFTPAKVKEARVLKLASQVKYVADEAAWFGEKRGLVNVTLRNGETLSRSTPELLGFPSRPYSQKNLEDKFRENASLAVRDAGQLETLLETLQSLERLEDIGVMMRLTVAD